MFLNIETEPGTIVYIAWKSITLNSVAIADAKQGKLIVEVPQKKLLRRKAPDEEESEKEVAATNGT